MAGAWLAGGCGNLADPDEFYAPLEILYGEVAGAEWSTTEYGLALVWYARYWDGTYVVDHYVPTTGEWNHGFVLPLYYPPPEAALVPSEQIWGAWGTNFLPPGTRYGFGFFALYDPTVWNPEMEEAWIKTAELAAVDETQLIVYHEGPDALVDWDGEPLNAPLAPGFNRLALADVGWQVESTDDPMTVNATASAVPLFQLCPWVAAAGPPWLACDCPGIVTGVLCTVAECSCSGIAD